MFESEKIFIRKRPCILLKQACCYHFKLSGRKTPVLFHCFVKNQACWHMCWLHLLPGKRPLWSSMSLRSFRFRTVPLFDGIKNFRYKEMSEKYSSIKVLKRVKLLKILSKVLINTWSSTRQFIFKRTQRVFLQDLFKI